MTKSPRQAAVELQAIIPNKSHIAGGIHAILDLSGYNVPEISLVQYRGGQKALQRNRKVLPSLAKFDETLIRNEVRNYEVQSITICENEVLSAEKIEGSPFQLDVVVPAHAVGYCDISVTDGLTGNKIFLSQAFEYVTEVVVAVGGQNLPSDSTGGISGDGSGSNGGSGGSGSGGGGSGSAGGGNSGDSGGGSSGGTSGGGGGFSSNPSDLIISDGPTYNFGPTPLLNELTKIFTVTNPGASPVSGITVAGPAGAFSIRGNSCGSTLNSGTCEITIAFRPTASGVEISGLTVGYNSGAKSVSVSLQGTGVDNRPSFIGSGSQPQFISSRGKLYATWLHNLRVQVAYFNENDANPQWVSVDGGGILRDSTRGAQNPQITEFNSKLYLTWSEKNGYFGETTAYMRVAVYNGNDSSPAWNYVDGDGDSGLNLDPEKHAVQPQLTVYNSKLYLTWSEGDPLFLFPGRIHVKVYNGNDSAPQWTLIDGPVPNLNGYYAAGAYTPQLTAFNNKLYLSWNELVSGTTIQSRVRVFNGNDANPRWDLVDNGGIGQNGKSSLNSQLTVFNSKLYSIRSEDFLVTVSVYNGNDLSPNWTSVDGIDGINRDPSMRASQPQLTIYNSQLYAVWAEDNGSAMQIRLARYNGDDGTPKWTSADGSGINGLNSDGNVQAIEPQITTHNSKLYGIWTESTGIYFKLLQP